MRWLLAITGVLVLWWLWDMLQAKDAAAARVSSEQAANKSYAYTLGNQSGGRPSAVAVGLYNAQAAANAAKAAAIAAAKEGSNAGLLLRIQAACQLDAQIQYENPTPNAATVAAADALWKHGTLPPLNLETTGLEHGPIGVGDIHNENNGVPGKVNVPFKLPSGMGTGGDFESTVPLGNWEGQPYFCLFQWNATALTPDGKATEIAYTFWAPYSVRLARVLLEGLSEAI